MTPPAYFDNAASTRIHPEVREEMERKGGFGNPSSLHRVGREARRVLEDARETTADLLGADPKEILFTSGATEADNLAVLGTARARRSSGDHVVTTAVEHPAVLAACRALEREGFRVTRIPCDGAGRVDPAEIERALTPRTILTSVMLANNEVGTVQPVKKIAAAARGRKIPIHCDAAQACGKLPLRLRDLGVDLLTLSAHKMHGPRGSGVLVVRRGVPLEPLLLGGGQEFERRAGTENVTAAVGFAAALRVAERDREGNVGRMERLRLRLRNGISSIGHLQWNGHETERLPSLLNVSFEYVDGEAVILALDAEGICVSSGSACASLSLEPSHVLSAMGIPKDVARGSVRFSVAADTTDEEVDHALSVVPNVIARLRSISAVGGE